MTVNGQTHTATAAIAVSAAGAGLTITTPNHTFSPDYLAVPPGAAVTWTFSGATHNVTFEDRAPPGGNVPDTAPGASVSRTFQALGDYDYECTIHKGMKGRIRVR
jgi:plastocyanin